MSTLLLLGGIQGGLTGFGLLLYAGRKNGTHWLALGLLALSLTLLRLWTHAIGLESEPLFRRLPLSVDLAIMPLFYLYALSLTAAPKASVRRAIAWLLPWAVFMGYSVLVYLAGIGQGSIEFMDAVAKQLHYAQSKQLEDHLTLVLNLVLAVLIWLRVSQYHERVADWVPERYAALLRLLKIGMALALVTAAVNLIDYAATELLRQGDRSYVRQAAYAFYVALVYIAGVVGFRLKDLPQFSPASPEPVAPERAGPGTSTSASFQQLQVLMQAKRLFTEPDLNLNDVAKHLGLTAPEASRLIKEGSGKNFRAYINDFRIEAVKQKLADASYAEVSILAIALESGFNAESSFYRVFKAATGVSPTEFRQRR